MLNTKSRVFAGLALLTPGVLLNGCADSELATSLDPGPARFAYTGPAMGSTTNPTLVGEFLKVCKAGTDADFVVESSWTAPDGVTIRTFAGQYRVADGTCIFASYARTDTEDAGPSPLMDPTTVKVTEVVPAGFQVQSIDATEGNPRPGESPTPQTTTHTGTNSVTVQLGGGSTSIGFVGAVVKFTNAPLPPPPSGRIGDFVWRDNNGNGIQEAGEPGIAGVTVTLTGGPGGGQSTTTDANGHYLFAGLPAGDYTVAVGTPAGFLTSPSGAGGDPAMDSNGSPAAVALSTNSSSDLTIDFGFTPAPPALLLTKTPDQGTAGAGNPIGFVMTVTNTGSGTATGVTLNDPLPTRDGTITWSIDYTGSTAGCSLSANLITCSFGSLTPGASATVHVVGNTQANSCGVVSNTATAQASNHAPISASASVDIQCAPRPFAGCTPGFWKQAKHYQYWANYSPAQLVGSVFGNSNLYDRKDTKLSGYSLAAGLSFQGGSTLSGAAEILLRASVAALLNAQSPSVNYPNTPSEVINSVNAALASQNRDAMLGLATRLDEYNNARCTVIDR